MEEDHARKHRGIPTVSAILSDGSIVEMVLRSEPKLTLFAVYSSGRWTLQQQLDIDKEGRFLPFSPRNNLISNQVVLFPSEPRFYGGEQALVGDIQAFIHRYVDLSLTFEKVARYYVILSWLYDAFNELPYLRLRGDCGSGKTRALLTIGSLWFFASGASTISPLFHTTFLFDEADFPLQRRTCRDCKNPKQWECAWTACLAHDDEPPARVQSTGISGVWPQNRSYRGELR